VKYLLVGGLLLALSGVDSCQKEAPTLSLLVWEGYAEPSVIGPFEEAYHCKVSVSYIKTSDDLLQKLLSGNAYDVISPSSDVANTIAEHGLVRPLELSRIASYTAISPQLRQMDLVKMKARPFLPFLGSSNRVYGIPFMWGPNTLLYNTAILRERPTSWAVLWDPKYRGKISVWDDVSTIYMTAQVLGYDKADPNALYNLSDQQLQSVTNKLLDLKPNIFQTWSTAGEIVNFFEKGNVVAAMAWPLVTSQLKARRFPIGEIIPEENTTGWVDRLMIPNASTHETLAYKFVNYMIDEGIQNRVARVTGYIPANQRAALSIASEKELDNYWKLMVFLHTVRERDRYSKTWNEVRDILSR